MGACIVGDRWDGGFMKGLKGWGTNLIFFYSTIDLWISEKKKHLGSFTCDSKDVVKSEKLWWDRVTPWLSKYLSSIEGQISKSIFLLF